MVNLKSLMKSQIKFRNIAGINLKGKLVLKSNGATNFTVKFTKKTFVRKPKRKPFWK